MGFLKNYKFIFIFAISCTAFALALFIYPQAPFYKINPDHLTRVLTPSRVSNLNLIENFDPFLWRIRHLVFLNLLDWDAKSNRPKPSLASAWNEQRQVLRFTLDPNQKWHDGQPVRIADVLFSINIQIGEQSKSLYQGMFQEVIESVRVVDGQNLEIKTKTPSSYHLRALGDRLQIYPQHVYSNPVAKFFWPKKWIGSGPYRVVNFEADRRLDLQRIGEEQTIEIQFVPSLNRRLDLIKSHQADWSELTWRETFKIQKEDQDLLYKNDLGGRRGIVWLLLNHRNPYLSNTKIRQALMYGFDRTQASRLVYNSELTPGSSYWPMPHAYSNPQNKRYPFDSQKARNLLTEVELKDGERIEFEVLLIEPEDQALLDLFAKAMAELGINVKITVLAAQEAYRRIEEGDYDAYVMSMPRFYDDMNLRFQFHSQKANRWPVFKFSSENTKKIDELTEGIEHEFDAQKRQTLHRRLDAVLNEELPHLFWFEIPTEQWLKSSTSKAADPPW